MPYDITVKRSTNTGNQLAFGTDGGLHVPTQPTYGIKIFDDATTITTGTAKFLFVVPSTYNLMKLYSAETTITTASSSGTVAVTIRGVTPAITNMFSNTVQIPSPSLGSGSSGGTLVGGTNVVQTNHVISIDVTSAGTGAKGLAVYLGFRY
jgi:hypothetical protein